jgi:hypothetical protein
MAAYLVVDVDDLLQWLKSRAINLELQELAISLRATAALASGVSADRLRAIAVGDWQKYRGNRVDVQQIYRAAGYEIFDIPRRESVPDALIINYFSFDPEPVSELILATTSRDLMPLVKRIKMTRNARIRVWGAEDILKGTPFEGEVIFQPIQNLLGIQTKNVAVYIDFENIAISLNEQSFIVDLDHLISSFVKQARAHGQVIKMAAYAPWGQRGSLPPLVDASGRELSDEAPSRLALASIDPVFNLPGKNSADMRIARDVIMDAGHFEAADVYIMASGDRDFNDVFNTLAARGKQVIVWGVRGATSRQIENNPSVTVEFIDDFTNLQPHGSLGKSSMAEEQAEAFTPSQWSSVVVQFDRVAQDIKNDTITIAQLIEQLQLVGAVISKERGDDLVQQAISLGIIKQVTASGQIQMNPMHPIVEKTRLVRDRIVMRVANTLQVRGWEYVNYGFLLKGLAMDREMTRPGLNLDDQWRSHWIDALVREHVLERQLTPHRHNPDDLVPVIKLSSMQVQHLPFRDPTRTLNSSTPPEELWLDVSIDELAETESITADMVRRIVVSVEQFTSFRGFAWCPLGSLHRRLKLFDNSISFQRGVEYLVANAAAQVNEYPNPLSTFNTKGISLVMDSSVTQRIISERNTFIKILLALYKRDMLISKANIEAEYPQELLDLDLWLSIMETENVLNALPSRAGQYSLFRTHHTVNLVAAEEEGLDAEALAAQNPRTEADEQELHTLEMSDAPLEVEQAPPPEEDPAPQDDPPPAKPKRVTRRKKADDTPQDAPPPEDDPPKKRRRTKKD